jgi:hypothetical protein
MMQNDDEKEGKNWKFRGETVLVVISLFINFAVMVQWFTALENRLTKIETTIEIKLSDKHYFNHYKEQDQKL